MPQNAGRRRHTTTTMMTLTVTLVVLAHLPARAWGFSLGAPDTTCGNMEPVHGVPRQSTPAPYTVTPSVVEIEGGKQMLVTLQAAEGTAFKGFLVQARSSDNQQIVGTFFTTDHKYLNCNNGMNNAVTHQGPASKTKVTLTWEPPSGFAGDVIFIGTFVQQKSVYWVGVTSEKVTVKRAVRPAPPPPPEAAAVATTTPTTTTTTTPTTTTTTTTTTTAPPSVSPADKSDHEVNAGDVLVHVVDAPSPVVENDISVVTPQGDSPPSPTTLPSSPPSPTSTPIIPTPSEVSTDSSDLSIANEEEEDLGEEEPLPEEIDSSKPTRPSTTTTRRKFGLLGRRRTTSTTTTTTTSTSTTTAGPPKKFLPELAKLERDLINIYDGCGTGKGCFGHPANCEDTKSCTMLVTYSKGSSGFQFEVMSSITSGYVAAGLSDDEKMGDDSVMACIVTGSGADIKMGFNNGKSNELLVEDKYGLDEIQTAVIDGKTYCAFVRHDSTEISGLVFDLNADRFHLMLSKGPVTSNGLSYHDKRSVSSGTVALNSFESVEVRSDLFRTLHACFMVAAWICAASCGIMVARYYKKTWIRHRSCGIDQWFHLHRFFMGLTWSLTVTGFILIVYYINGWTDLDARTNPHAILGIVSTCLCFIQPFMALCRCAPTAKNRPIFNWFHWFVGNSAQILGIAAIFFGFDLIAAPNWVIFILIIFIAFHCLVHLLLSVGQCTSESRAAESSSNVYPMKELNGSRSPLQPSEKNTDAPGAGFRKVILFFYFLGNFIITAALLLVITVDVVTLKDWGLIFWEK